MPARSISRCDTISASFGVSRRMGRKKRDGRMDFLMGLVDDEVIESGSAAKTQGLACFFGNLSGVAASISVLGWPEGRKGTHARGHQILSESAGGHCCRHAYDAMGRACTARREPDRRPFHDHLP